MTPAARSGRKATPGRVYKSTPASARQIKFPHRRTTIQSSRRSSTSSKPSRKSEAPTEEDASSQSTLTQYPDWIPRDQLVASSSGGDFDVPSSKRRKTEGSTSPIPKKQAYHTQTLTQWSANHENSTINDSDGESLTSTVGDLGNDRQEEGQGDRFSSVVPQTPQTERVKVEIASSQGSPFTVLDDSPLTERNPLQDKPVNTNTQSPSKVSKRPRTFVVQDSNADSLPRSSLASAENLSPAKSQPKRKESEPETETETTVRSRRARRSDVSQVLGEDAAGEEKTEIFEPSRPTPRRSKGSNRVIADSEDEFDDLDSLSGSGAEDNYGMDGHETQVLVRGILNSLEREALKEELSHQPPSPIATKVRRNLNKVDSPKTRAVVRIQSPSENQAAIRTAKMLPPKAPLASQGLESQRVPLDTIRAMAPQTDRSDIFISIHPQHVDNIVAGKKNHEFRNYRIPNTVARMWIYVTAPSSELRYMASISGAKRPGEIEDETGIGNEDFNAGRKDVGFAYELLEVFELNNPVPLATMKDREWLQGPPQKYNYVPPTVVGHLMANLRCSIFGEESQDEEDDEDGIDLPSTQRVESTCSSTPKVTVSQEVTNQILSEATQHHSPGHDLPSSSSVRAQPQHRRFAPPPRPPPKTTPRRAVNPSQATTVSQVSNATPLASMPPQSYPQSSSSVLCLQEAEDDPSPLHFSGLDSKIRSSQLLTKSQMLPDSLLRGEHDQDEAEGEVDIVYDSEGEDDEL